MAPFKKVLVANRGEIAIRVFRACRDLDIQTVAVYSEADRDAAFLDYADESYLLGPTPPAESYLNQQRLLDVAKKAGAEAIHPGYGFLSENPTFAKAVVDAGLVWIGPPPEAVVAMGDKVSARKVAHEAGVASVPGTDKPIASYTEIAEFAKEHGWPVAIKAAHGGGGRGFRVVREESEAESGFEAAGREAMLAFGNADAYIERYLEEPRHVEIQVMADSSGNVIHLGERDCSLQRRHQKLVEESPSPAVDDAVRAAMGEAAVKVAVAASYVSAGTVEFLLEQTDDGPKFWFLEMNTRLQVEHPVTEAVTGLDLAKEMILVASGEQLSLSQSDVQLRGHAIELRINAENPAKNFMPNPGTITAYSEPGGPGVRVDSAVREGSEIPQSYDSLIAKLICFGRDRPEAIARTRRALSEFVIEGPATTIPFHALVLESEWFRTGDFSTKTVERDLDLKDLKQPESRHRPEAKRDAKANELLVEVDGKRMAVRVVEEGARKRPKPPEQKRAGGHSGAGENLIAPMQGVIVKTLVTQGSDVKAGDGIVVLEAMKMENMISCHRDGVVKELKVAAGDPVQLGATLAIIE
ncbi:MAG TPA: acetyl-CoA carboxylase biotin carboxylase subunit [Actinomycetota bacterium]|nr:acetyl-CoA carboxylase biotin carboxylase subunit [Actinomycetota bacterium]